MKHIQEYKTFINESSFDNAFIKANVIEILDGWYGKNLNISEFTKKCPLFRGFGDDNAKKIGVGGYFKEYKKPRISPNAVNNFYNIYLSNAKEWSKFPKRNMSLICTTSIHKARDYRPVYKIIPIPGAKIAMCPSGDIWDSFDIGLRLADLSRLIEFICNYNKINSDIFESWPKTEEFIKFVSNNITVWDFQNMVSNSGIRATRDDYMKFVEEDEQTGCIKFDVFLRKYFDPSKFEIFDFNPKSPKFKIDKEFWFEDEAVFLLI